MQFQFNEKYYIGYPKDNEAAEVFRARPQDATPEASGYEIVDGPFDTKQEAEEELERARG